MVNAPAGHHAGIAPTGMPTRGLGPRGRVARLVVGGVLLTIAVFQGVSWLDTVLGLLLANIAVTLVLLLRGLNAPPLRAVGPVAHCLNCATIVLFFVLLPISALLFYGSTMILAAFTGTPGCEVSVVSNLLLRRRDEIGCPFFAALDAVDARADQLVEALPRPTERTSR